MHRVWHFCLRLECSICIHGNPVVILKIKYKVKKTIKGIELNNNTYNFRLTKFTPKINNKDNNPVTIMMEFYLSECDQVGYTQQKTSYTSMLVCF